MRRLCWILSALFAIAQVNLVPAETRPIRLAIIAGNDTLDASDLLTTTLSVNNQITLLERAQIEKILREQKLSAQGLVATDALKVGQIIGADGLLTLDVAREGTNTLLNARLIAVKQGVVMDLQQMAWPLKDLSGWSKITADHFKPLFPKLSVLQKDAIPISILNLRSSVSSSEGRDTERDLTLLLLNRLTHETNVFVLERRRLDQLTQEKKFNNLEDSPFWNGAYLLEGTIDKNGFAKETITITARLRSPDGTESNFEVSGSRKELATVINDLAARILASLKQTNSSSWNPQDEATQYFHEATWALRWGMIKEAQAASESAWALGKKDLECASVRVNCYIPDVLADTGKYMEGASTGFDEDRWRRSELRDIKKQYGDRAFARLTSPTSIDYVVGGPPPKAENLDQALHLLELYADFTATLPDQEPALRSSWHTNGLHVLEAASLVLQDFHFAKSSQLPVAEKLAEVRHLCRLVAERISRPESVRKEFWVGSRIAPYDDLYKLRESSTLFKIKLMYGCFWQDKPEDGVRLYEELMTSDVFVYIHNDFWLRPLQAPWLATWNAEDEKRAPTVWKDFVHKLETSANAVHQIEAKCLKVEMAFQDVELEAAFKNLCSTVLTNRASLVTNNVDVVYPLRYLDDVLKGRDSHAVDSLREQLEKRYRNEYQPQLSSITDEGREQMRLRKDQEKHLLEFESQKQFLRTNATTTGLEFFQTFAFAKFTSAEAKEITPLLQAFKEKNLQLYNEQSSEQQFHSSLPSHIHSVERRLQTAQTSPSYPPPWLVKRPPSKIATPSASAPKPTIASKPLITPKRLSETNAISVIRFFPIPLDRLQAKNRGEVRIFAHRFRGQKLLLDLRWADWDDTGALPSRSAVAIFDAKTTSWDVIPYPARKRHDLEPYGWMVGEVERGLFMELFQGALYASESNGLKKFNFQTRRWELLNLPDQKLSQLFAINNRLYASNDEAIFEIVDGGKSMRILASCRRRPAATSLDHLTSLGSPVIFPGPNQSIRTLVAGNVYTWNERDWMTTFSTRADQTPVSIGDTTILRVAGAAAEISPRHARLWLLPDNSTNAQLSLEQRHVIPYPTYAAWGFGSQQGSDSGTADRPKWKVADDLVIDREGACTQLGSNWLFLAETRTASSDKIPAPSDYHLICYDPAFSKPVSLPLTFVTNTAAAPTVYHKPGSGIWNGHRARWMEPAGDYLLLGQASLGGVWAIPLPELKNAVSASLQKEATFRSKQAADALQAQASLLNKYDLNKNGIFDDNEKAAMIDEPQWLESQWPEIDSNKNYFLDEGDNLLFFDADSDGVASEKELAAIKAIQPAIASALLKEFDVNMDGFIDSREAAAIGARRRDASAARSVAFIFHRVREFDLDKDGRLNAEELAAMLEDASWTCIVSSPKIPDSVRFLTARKKPTEEDRQRRLKESLEIIWKELRPSAKK